MRPDPRYLYIGIKGHVVCIRKEDGGERWRTPLAGSGFTNVVVEPDGLYASTVASCTRSTLIPATFVGRTNCRALASTSAPSLPPTRHRLPWPPSRPQRQPRRLQTADRRKQSKGST